MNLLSALTEAGRVLAQDQGWYEQRQFVQLVFIALAAMTCLIAAITLLLWARNFPNSHPNRSDRHHDGSRLCINPRGIPPPRRLAYSPKNSGSALELDSRNERNQLGPFCKSMAPSWCKIDVEIGPCQSKKIAVIRCLARLALSLRPLSGLAEDEEPRGARREARGRRRLGPGPMATPLILKRANASRSSGQWRDDNSPRAGFAHRLKDTSDRSVDVAIDLRSEVAADRVDNDQLHVANLGNLLVEPFSATARRDM